MGSRGIDDYKVHGLRLPSRLHHSKSYSDKKQAELDIYERYSEVSDRIKLDVGHLKGSPKSAGKPFSNPEVESCLKQEILQLEKKLHNQFETRHALEKALVCRSYDTINVASVPKPATDLIKEIATLELEVVYLEQHLLSLYRKAFDQQATSSSPSSKDAVFQSPLTTPRKKRPEFLTPDSISKREHGVISSSSLSNPWKESQINGVEEKFLDSGVHRCQSSLSQRSALSNRSPPADFFAKTVLACHSQPLSMMEFAQNDSSNLISLAEHLGTRISDHVQLTPNRLSEDMIKCMSAIYCKLSDPPVNHGIASPNSSLSSMSAFSPEDQFNMWSPISKKDSSFDAKLDNPFHVEGLKDFSGPYSTMIEVRRIYSHQKSTHIENLLADFRSLITRLEEVDPRKLKHEEKLAFWINIHNALAMHTFLAYGIAQNNVKRVFLLLKAAYNIGGQTISAEAIQSSILRCRTSRPGQWLRLLLSSRTRFKNGDGRQAYAIEHPEPLLHFALCSGSHSDPAVRVYTPKQVLQELESAKEDYIRENFGVRRDHKILLPKVVELHAKDLGLSHGGTIEMVQQSLPESLKKSVKRCQVLSKSHKNIVEWVPHNFAFRYLITKELAK